MLKRKIWASLMILTIASLALAACTPANVTPVVVTSVVTQIIEGTPVEVVKEVTAVPTPAPTEPKVMVVCMAQEPQTLYTLSEAALVKSAVLEAVYDWGVDARSYSYQPVGIVELPSFDNALATQTEVEVGVGDTVYDAATDAVVTLSLIHISEPTRRS